MQVELQQLLKKMLEKVGVVDNKIEIIKIWENARPTEDFYAQTMTSQTTPSLDLSSYDLLIISYKPYKTYATKHSMIVKKNDTFDLIGSSGASGDIYASSPGVLWQCARRVITSDTSIQFYEGRRSYSSTAWSANNASIVPTEIYGVSLGGNVQGITSGGSSGVGMSYDVITEAEIDAICGTIEDDAGLIPVATRNGLGCVAIGDGLNIASNGLLNVDAVADGGEMRELLWENANPTSSFAAQKISLDLAEYNQIGILTPKQMHYFDITSPNKSYALMVSTASSTSGWYWENDSREFTVDSTGITFKANYTSRQGNTTGVVENLLNIPQKIYGIKRNEADLLNDGVPVGTITQFGGETAPRNWLFLNGQAVSRTEYPELFALYGTKYGSGDGSTTFNLPDFRGRVPVGLSSSDTEFDTLGEKGGAKTQELAAAIGATNNDPSKIGYCGTDPIPGISNYTYTVHGTGYASYQTAINHGTQVKVLSTGADPSLIQPYLTVNFIVKAKPGLLAGREVADFVVERGTSGDWSYEKWYSGKAECWTDKAITLAVNCNAAIYGGYAATNAIEATFPISFIENPSVIMTGTINNYVGDIIHVWGTRTSAIGSPLCHSSGSRSVSYMARAIGKWK